jgi:hypothetical protein
MSNKQLVAFRIFVFLLTILVLCVVTVYLYPKPFVIAWFKQQYRVSNSKPKMLLVSRSGVGEKEQGARILIALKRLGINARVVRAFEKGSIYNRFIPDRALLAAETMQPDFILTLERGVPPLSHIAPNYLVLDQSSNNYIQLDANNNPTLINPAHYEFASLLPSFKEIDLVKKAYEANGRTYTGFNWIPTVQRTVFKAQIPEKLFYPGGDISDDTRSKQKYIDVFKKLDQTGYFEVYGRADRWRHTPKSFRGSIPFDGKSMLKINNKAGVTLILHAKDHLDHGIPTGRIFEAASANTVIISDRNQYVIDNFGDNVLYIDVTQDAPAIFSQIDQHMQWIFTHQQQARQMAERCHAIFMQQFTLEQQLQQLLAIAL